MMSRVRLSWLVPQVGVTVKRGAVTAGVIALMGTVSAINIDCGRQLFVDDVLIASTNGVVRHWNHPVKAERPVLDFGATDGGLWWDPTRGKYRLWYQQKWLGDVHYAESVDGIRWTQPALAAVPGTNRVFRENIPLDSWSVHPDYAAADPYAHWCLHVSTPGGTTDDTLYESADGLCFAKIGVAGKSGDRSSVYYDPFRREWVFALRDYRDGIGRATRRAVSPTFAGAKWKWPQGAEKWLVATNRPNWQLYNFDAVPYESLMLGVMEVLYNTPNDNGDCLEAGLPKQTALHFCFSRDGKTFVPRDEADIAPSGWGSGKWDTGYLSPVGGICTVSDDELRFYYTGLRGDGTRLTKGDAGFAWAKNGMYANAALGYATLRRDGFVGLVADSDGEIVTQPLVFTGGHLFVNADARFGAISAEVLDEKGAVLEGFAAEDALIQRRIDGTKIELGWKSASLASVTGKTVRFRFRLQVATLYAFWVAKSAQGESQGFVSAGGPEYPGLRDELSPQPCTRPIEWEFPRTGNCHEGLPFSDGVTGVLVWGGGETINLTVGRADLWDHRGGYPWTAGQNYTNIVRLVEEGNRSALDALFKKETPKGEPRNPYMLPLGRVVIKLSGGATPVRGELDPFSGLGRLFLSDGKAIELAMSKKSGALAMRFPEGVAYALKSVPSTDFPVYEQSLKPMGFEKAVVLDGKAPGCGGFRWKLPADEPAWLTWGCAGRECTVKTGRGDKLVTEGAGRFAAVAAESVAQWTAFWEKGAKVRVPDTVLQRIFDYGMYRFGAMTDPDGVPAGLQGPWLEDDKLVPWNGDYHFNINVQECYSPAFRGGHFEHLMPLFKMVLSWRPRLRDNAKKFVGIDDGYVLPHSVDNRGVCIGGFWAGTIDHGSTAWVADMMARYVKYSGDVGFLRNGGLDFMKGAMNVYRAMMEERDGRLSIPVAPSPEWSGGSDVRQRVGRDPSFQLALAHRLCSDLIEMSARLGEKADPMWLEVRSRLPLYTGGKGGVWLYEGQPLTASHRHHSHLAGFYPFDVIPFGQKLVDETMCAWMRCGTGGWTGWCVPWASALYTHFGESRAAVGMLRAWDRYFCDEGHGSHHNAVFCGFTSWSWGRGVMQMDGQCAAATAVMELLVHEVNGKTEFFRGCPPEWKDVSFENIALSDGRRVSGRRSNGDVSLIFDK